MMISALQINAIVTAALTTDVVSARNAPTLAKAMRYESMPLHDASTRAFAAYEFQSVRNDDWLNINVALQSYRAEIPTQNEGVGLLLDWLEEAIATRLGCRVHELKGYALEADGRWLATPPRVSQEGPTNWPLYEAVVIASPWAPLDPATYALSR